MPCISGKLTPGYFSAGQGAGGGSFFILPMRILDQESAGVGTAAFDINFRFQTNPNNNILQNKTVDNTFIDVPDQPQWRNNNDNSSLFSVRHTSLEGDGTPVFDFPTIDVWRAISTSRTFGMDRPAAGTSRFLTFTVELAVNTDLTDIQARAVFTLRYTRP